MVERESAEPEEPNFAAGAGAQFLALELKKRGTDEHLETPLGADQGGLGLKKTRCEKGRGKKVVFVYLIFAWLNLDYFLFMVQKSEVTIC